MVPGHPLTEMARFTSDKAELASTAPLGATRSIHTSERETSLVMCDLEPEVVS